MRELIPSIVALIKKYDAEYGGVAALAALKCVPSRVPHLVVHIPTRSQYRRAFQSIGILYGRLLLPSLDTSLKHSPSDRSILSEQLTRTQLPWLRPRLHITTRPHCYLPINLSSGPVSPSAQGISRSPSSPRTARHPQAVILAPKLSGSMTTAPSPFQCHPPHIPTPRSGPSLAPTAFNLSHRTRSSYWTWSRNSRK